MGPSLLSMQRLLIGSRRWFSPAVAQLAHSNEPRITPTFWKGQQVIPKEKYTIDCRNYDMSDGPEKTPELVKKMNTTFDDVGLVLLRNTNLEGSLDKMGTWARVPMGGANRYEGGANMRGEVVANVYDVGAPNSAYLQFHHEMAYVRQSIKYLGFCASKCIETTPEEPHRGRTFLSENGGATKSLLATDFGQKLKDKGVCYIRCLTDAEEGTPSSVYNHWQISFGTNDPKEVERLAAEKGLIIAWGPGRYLRTKYYVSAFEYFPQWDKNVLYSAIADHGSWFDTWPGVAELPDLESFETATPDQKPLKMTFGDDNPFTREELVQYADVYDQHGFPLAWQEGDIGVFCNYRFAHGRFGFQLKEGEERVLGVCLGGMYDRVGSLPGKW